MKQIVDEVPVYLISKYSTYQAFQQALKTGEVFRDQYGYFHCVDTYQQQYITYDPTIGNPVYMNEPVQNYIETNDKQILEGQQFDFFNIEGVNVCFKMIDLDGHLSYISMVSAEDIAIGAGLTTLTNSGHPTDLQKVAGQVNKVESIRWSTFNQYAQEALPTLMLDKYYEPILRHFIPSKIGKGSWIPTALAVLIIMRCTSKKAREFQKIVSIKITNELNCLAAKKYNFMMDIMKKQIAEYNQRLRYQDSYLNKDSLLTSTQIASQFGMTAQELHAVLYKAGVIQKNKDIWVVKSPYNHFAYTRLVDIDTPAGKKTVTYWTESGRGWIDGILFSLGIIPEHNNQSKIQEYLKES